MYLDDVVNEGRLVGTSTAVLHLIMPIIKSVIHYTLCILHIYTCTHVLQVRRYCTYTCT